MIIKTMIVLTILGRCDMMLSRNLVMEEIAISKFKATCLAVLERVRVTNQPIRVTRFGKPIAEILPPRVGEKPQRRFGMGRGRILGDIVSPAVDLSDWEAEAEEGPQK
jgi:antitoxin (DNA-binding transcriptional repressor) of toxin-antitoxin stability system